MVACIYLTNLAMNDGPKVRAKLKERAPALL